MSKEGDAHEGLGQSLRFTTLPSLTLWIFSPSFAHAGMPVFMVNDIVALRLQDISFFLLLFLVSGAGLRLLWNSLAKEFPVLPRLSWKRGYAFCLLLSILLLLVLAMISGARELLTPGAWRRQGQSYRLNEPASDTIRRQGLEALRTALFDYSKTHDGKFPRHDFVPEIPAKIWQSPDSIGTYYIYPGLVKEDSSVQVLAYEPPAFGDNRLVLLTSGEIKFFKTTEIQEVLKQARALE